jgi:hypothetical protein
MRVALFLVLLVPAARAEGIRASVSGGLGVAHDGLGVQLELGADHFTGFVGFSAFRALTLGTRWSLRPDGSGFGVSVQGLVALSSGEPDPDLNYRETLTIVSLTLHWRWRWGPFFLDAGAGPAVTFDSYRFPTADNRDPRDDGRLVRQTCFGIPLASGPGSCSSDVLPLAFDLSLGLAF